MHYLIVRYEVHRSFLSCPEVCALSRWISRALNQLEPVLIHTSGLLISSLSLAYPELRGPHFEACADKVSTTALK